MHCKCSPGKLEYNWHLEHLVEGLDMEDWSLEGWSRMYADPDLYDAEDPEGDLIEDEMDKIPVKEFDDDSGHFNWPPDHGIKDEPGGVPGSKIGDWNTIPFGVPADCRQRLLVVINSDANIAPRLRDTLAHLAYCNGAHGAKTSSVMFYLTGFFLSWQSEWIAYRAALEAALGAQKMGAPPIIRISVRRKPQHTFFTSEGRPAGGRDMLDWWRAAEPHFRGCLRRRLDFLRAHGVEQVRHCGFIEGYTQQPQGLVDKNVLSFGDYRATGVKMRDWRLRCYIVPGVPIGFAGRIKLPATPQVWGPPILLGDDNSAWLAVDANRFLTTPGDYLDLGKLP